MNVALFYEFEPPKLKGEDLSELTETRFEELFFHGENGGGLE